MSEQQSQLKQAKPQPKAANMSINTSTKKPSRPKSGQQQHQQVPEHEIKQNSGMSATYALQAMQKAWELRQAANAAGDPNAREEILAKAINKEIEAESFGKAAKYTRTGAFQGLAAGAGLGVQPGVTLGKLVGALVGGVVATVTGLLGGGIGSVYGAINGPFWDLREIASHGVRGIVGDFPNWKSTPSQKKALEKMVMQTREQQAPNKEELEQMSKDAPDSMPQQWSDYTNSVTSWRPKMPGMPNMPNMPNVSNMSKGAAAGLGGLAASIPYLGGQGRNQPQSQGQQASQPPNIPQDRNPPETAIPKQEANQTTTESSNSPAQRYRRTSASHDTAPANAASKPDSQQPSNESSAKKLARSQRDSAPETSSSESRQKPALRDEFESKASCQLDKSRSVENSTSDNTIKSQESARSKRLPMKKDAELSMKENNKGSQPKQDQVMGKSNPKDTQDKKSDRPQPKGPKGPKEPKEKEPSKPQANRKSAAISQPQSTPSNNTKEKSPAAGSEKRKPRKLDSKSNKAGSEPESENNKPQPDQDAKTKTTPTSQEEKIKRRPRKLESRRAAS